MKLWLFCALALASSSALAATITVNTQFDEWDTSPNASCSIREAVNSINTQGNFGGCNASGAYGTNDTINLGAAYYTLTRIPASFDDLTDAATGDIEIRRTCVIQGTGASASDATIEAAGGYNDRAFELAPLSGTITVTMRNLTLWLFSSQNNNNGVSGHDWGGAVLVRQNATLLADKVHVKENTTTTANGGGVANVGGVVRFTNSAFTYNTATGSTHHGGGFAQLNGISSSSFVNTTFMLNTSVGNGGGVFNNGGAVALHNCTFNRNKSATGGGISTHNATITLRNTVLAENTGTANAPSDCACTSGPQPTSYGYNFMGITTGCSITGATGDQLNSSLTAPDISLRYVAVPLPYAALYSSGNLTDKGNPSGCYDNASALIAQDQLSALRHAGSACDIGAYEVDDAATDYTLSASAGPNVDLGQQGYFDFVLTPPGSAVPQPVGATVEITIPNASIDSATYASGAASGSCTGSAPVSCFVPYPGLGMTGTIHLIVSPLSGGALGASGVITPDSKDPIDTNDAASASLNVTPVADMAVVEVAGADAVVGAQSSRSLTVHNYGPADVTGVVVTLAPQSGLVFDSVDYSGVGGSGACTTSGPATCNVGAMASGTTATITITTTPTIAVTKTASVHVSSAVTDRDMSDNNATLTVVSVDPPPPGPTGPSGTSGSSGSTGSSGSSGASGTSGDTGDASASGDTGASGVSGPSGATGDVPETGSGNGSNAGGTSGPGDLSVSAGKIKGGCACGESGSDLSLVAFVIVLWIRRRQRAST